jgi:hypothetical protein
MRHRREGNVNLVVGTGWRVRAVTQGLLLGGHRGRGQPPVEPTRHRHRIGERHLPTRGRQGDPPIQIADHLFSLRRGIGNSQKTFGSLDVSRSDHQRPGDDGASTEAARRGDRLGPDDRASAVRLVRAYDMPPSPHHPLAPVGPIRRRLGLTA